LAIPQNKIKIKPWIHHCGDALRGALEGET